MRPCPGKWNDIKPSPEMRRFVSVKSEGKISEEKLLICCLLWRNALQTVRRKNAEGEIWMFVIFCVDFETQRCEKQYFFLKLFQTWNDEWHPEIERFDTAHMLLISQKTLFLSVSIEQRKFFQILLFFLLELVFILLSSKVFYIITPFSSLFFLHFALLADTSLARTREVIIITQQQRKSA